MGRTPTLTLTIIVLALALFPGGCLAHQRLQVIEEAPPAGADDARAVLGRELPEREGGLSHRLTHLHLLVSSPAHTTILFIFLLILIVVIILAHAAPLRARLAPLPLDRILLFSLTTLSTW